MNKKLSMAVASAVMAFGASAAQAGITIPAGDWTVDIGGNVNAFYVNADCDDNGGAGPVVGGANSALGCSGDSQNVRTGLLPSALGIGAKTRQNDLDIAFQFTFFVGADDNAGGNGGGSNSLNIRQAYLTFGDKSWGTIKLGRDLGIFGSDAILSDMTLLGVGNPLGNSGGSSTLGRIGTGYIYADWVGQISYHSPNWNGFSFAVGARDPWGDAVGGAVHDNDNMGWEGKVSYEWGGDVSGKVWAEYINQKVEDVSLSSYDFDADGWGIGGKVAVAGFEAVGYYYDGDGIGQGLFLLGGGDGTGGESESDGWYVQGTYKLPTIGTKLGLSYGESNIEDSALFGGIGVDVETKSWTFGIYHPLTKSLNLVAEYSDIETDNNVGDEADADVLSLGAIMFF